MHNHRLHASILVTALLFVLPHAASADQFAYIDVHRAVAALDALNHAPREVQVFCAPCGDASAQAVAVRDLGISRVWDDGHFAQPYADDGGRTFWEVEINGAGIDLAYVYIKTSAGWENLALRLGLNATNVPRTLPIARLAR